jgi:hypothetical protein
VAVRFGLRVDFGDVGLFLVDPSDRPLHMSGWLNDLRQLESGSLVALLFRNALCLSFAMAWLYLKLYFSLVLIVVF